MILNLIILTLLFILFILYQSIATLMFGSGTIFENIVKMFSLIAGSLVIFHVFYNMYIYYSLMNSGGFVGPKGIEGLVGPTGLKGQCSSNCGQKVCSKLVLEHMTKILIEKGHTNLTNKFIINKVNKICHSDKYQGFLHSDNPNKPNEKELIEYIKDKCGLWLDKMLENENGAKFLRTPELPETFFDGDAPEKNPFIEIKKFEIWDWGDPYHFKPIIRRQCGLTENLPKVDSELNIIFTNRYELVYNNKLIDDIYGPEQYCLYNQLGKKRTNPRNITKCIYDENIEITSKEVFKQFEFTDYNKDISFYNVETAYLEELANREFLLKKQPYYQLGTIWRGTNDIKRNTISDIIGPTKETILVQDNDFREDNPIPNLKKIIDFDKIWSSNDVNYEKQNLVEIDFKQFGIENVTIWRPKPPANYVALGDFVTVNVLDPTQYKAYKFLRCIHKDLLENKGKDTFDIDAKVWDNGGFEIKYRKDLEPDTDPDIFKQDKTISIWAAGISEKDEEIRNLGHRLLTSVKDGGYNYFRASDSIQYDKPLETSYLIDPSKYTVSNKEDKKAPNNDYGVGWLGGKIREEEYSTYKKQIQIGFTPQGIIKHESIPKDNYKDKYFIEYDEEKDFYFIINKDNTGFNYLKINKSKELKWVNYEDEPISKNTNNIKDDKDYYWSIKILQNISEENKFYLITITTKNDTITDTDKTYLHFDSVVTIQSGESKWKLYPSTTFDT